MPRWRLANKLNPAKKAWKSFATKVQPKIQKLLKNSLPKAFKAATKRLLISFNYFLPSKLRLISNPNPSPYNYRKPNPSHFNTQQNYHMNQNAQKMYHKSFSAVHIDELFEPSNPCNSYDVNEEKNPGTSNIHDNNNNNNKGKRIVNVENDDQRGNWGKSKSTFYSIDDAWKAVVAASPQLRCVDERAEEFIFKVRKDMKLQKDKSDLEFQEMLARGA